MYTSKKLFFSSSEGGKLVVAENKPVLKKKLFFEAFKNFLT